MTTGTNRDVYEALARQQEEVRRVRDELYALTHRLGDLDAEIYATLRRLAGAA